jgi:hypothetical protein
LFVDLGNWKTVRFTVTADSRDHCCGKCRRGEKRDAALRAIIFP